MSLAPHAVRTRLALVLLSSVMLAALSVPFVAGLVGLAPRFVLVRAAVLGGSIVAGVTFFFAERTHFSRLFALNERLTRDHHGDPAGDPSASLEGLLDHLELRQQEAVRTARMAGMSDVSSALLHGVGQSMNGVQASLHALDSQILRMGVKDVCMLVEELDRHANDLGHYVTEDRRGRFLLPFLNAMSRSLVDLQGGMRAEIESVREGIGRVAVLISEQQRYVVGSNLAEDVDLTHELDHAIRIARLNFDLEGAVVVQREYDSLPGIRVDRPKLLGILLAMTQNAYEALAKRPEAARHLRLRVIADGSKFAVIEITDSGTGIAADLLGRVFESGFSTKPKARGLGLHVAANAARELGGYLQVQSDGPNQGTCQSLHLALDSGIPKGQARTPTESPVPVAD
jgi:signal transduction histidine kinase